MAYLLRARERLFGRPLLVTSEYAQVVVTAMSERLLVEPAVAQQVVDNYRRPNDRPVLDKRNGIAVYPVVGSMVHRGDGVDADSGMQSYTAMQRELTALMEDSSVRAILLDLDTPGGEAAGLTELAQWVLKARAEKPIWGIANTSACSGGYWLGSACTKLFAAPMSSVGSIGVVTMHTDVSKAMDKKGVVTTFVYAGKHKVDGNPFGPLPDDVKAGIQNRVDDLYGEFVQAVALQRGMDEAAVRNTEAGVFSPDQALQLGLVDGVGTLGDVLNLLSEDLSRPHVPGATIGNNMDKFVQADLDKARLDGEAAGIQLATSNITAALSVFAGSDPRVSTFVEALNDGVAPATAAKFAAKIEAPKLEFAALAPATTAVSGTAVLGTAGPTAAAVDAFMAAHTPGVQSDASAPAMGTKEARMAELSGSMKNYNQGKGYSPRA